MVTATMEDVRTMRGKAIVDSMGERIGKIDDVYFDEQTSQPEWALVHTGLFGTKSNFVPLTNMQMAGGDTVQVPFRADQVKNAPKVEADTDLSSEEEQELYSYYGIDWRQSQSGTILPGQEAQGQRQAPETMTRSEEQMQVGTAKRPSELVRLRKYVVTENVQQTVPVSHEEVRVEREPITEGTARQGAEMGESESEVTLMQEEPVVTKQVVPKEQVRLEKETVTEEERVTEPVRKEEVEVERQPAKGKDTERNR
jgi:uncharacterized protein (TIGR02271 family)